MNEDRKNLRIMLGFISQMVQDVKLGLYEGVEAEGVCAIQYAMNNDILEDKITPSLILRCREEAEKALIETFGYLFDD